MSKWEKEKENLLQFIENGISYEKIGRFYGCTGANIKKQIKLLGIKVENRRKINPSETFNKGKGKKCLNCGNPVRTRNSKFCSVECKREYTQQKLVEKWKDGKINGCDICGDIREFVKRYLMKKNDCKCERCGFDKVNEYTGLSILQIHHKDGDCFNTAEDNLELLCPNCHALTENFGSRNKNATRTDKRTKYYHDLISKSDI